MIDMTKEEIAEEIKKAETRAFWAKICISAGILIVLFVYRQKTYEIRWEELVLVALGVIPWFSSFMETFKLGKDGVEVKYLEDRLKALQDKVENEVQPIAEKAKEIATANETIVNDAVVKAEIANDAALRGVGKSPSSTDSAVVSSGRNRAPNRKNEVDPQKGKWGGKRVDEENGRRISVKVRTIKGEDYYRRLIVRVESTDPVNNPLRGKVIFHLHPSFKETVLKVDVRGGVAETSLVAYGAFTIGAEADEGRTKLEYDIAEDGANNPDPFYDR